MKSVSSIRNEANVSKLTDNFCVIKFRLYQQLEEIVAGWTFWCGKTSLAGTFEAGQLKGLWLCVEGQIDVKICWIKHVGIHIAVNIVPWLAHSLHLQKSQFNTRGHIGELEMKIYEELFWTMSNDSLMHILLWVWSWYYEMV